MPAGNKLQVTIATNIGQTFQITTYMSPDEIQKQVNGQGEFAGDRAIFRGLNDQDEFVHVELSREVIKGLIIAPWHPQVRTMPMPADAIPRGLR